MGSLGEEKVNMRRVEVEMRYLLSDILLNFEIPVRNSSRNVE